MTDRIDPYIFIPAAVVEAARRNMRSSLLQHFQGNERRLLEYPILGHVEIGSCEVPGVSTAQGRRLLEQCGRDPRLAFPELPRRSRHSMRRWALPPRLHEMLRIEALQHFQSLGYRVGEIVPEITEKS